MRIPIQRICRHHRYINIIYTLPIKIIFIAIISNIIITASQISPAPHFSTLLNPLETTSTPISKPQPTRYDTFFSLASNYPLNTTEINISLDNYFTPIPHNDTSSTSHNDDNSNNDDLPKKNILGFDLEPLSPLNARYSILDFRSLNITNIIFNNIDRKYYEPTRTSPYIDNSFNITIVLDSIQLETYWHFNVSEKFPLIQDIGRADIDLRNVTITLGLQSVEVEAWRPTLEKKHFYKEEDFDKLTFVNGWVVINRDKDMKGIPFTGLTPEGLEIFKLIAQYRVRADFIPPQFCSNSTHTTVQSNNIEHNQPIANCTIGERVDFGKIGEEDLKKWVQRRTPRYYQLLSLHQQDFLIHVDVKIKDSDIYISDQGLGWVYFVILNKWADNSVRSSIEQEIIFQITKLIKYNLPPLWRQYYQAERKVSRQIQDHLYSLIRKKSGNRENSPNPSNRSNPTPLSANPSNSTRFPSSVDDFDAMLDMLKGRDMSFSGLNGGSNGSRFGHDTNMSGGITFRNGNNNLNNDSNNNNNNSMVSDNKPITTGVNFSNWAHRGGIDRLRRGLTGE
jgi:hypothetical protein